MKLKDIYPHGFPPCFVPIELKIFQIPVHNCLDYVYMKPNEMYPNHMCIVVATELFIDIWKDSANRGTIEKWKQDRKLQSGWTDKHFKEGINNPVPLAVIARIQNNELYLRDGTTRTLWLLVHQAKAFPLSCPGEYAKALMELAGIEQLNSTIIPSNPRIDTFKKFPGIKNMFHSLSKIFKK